MTEDEMVKTGLELTEKFYNIFKDYWGNPERKELSMKAVFFINSVAFSSCMAQVVHHLFKKETEQKILNDYIDEIALFAKEQLEMYKDELKK